MSVLPDEELRVPLAQWLAKKWPYREDLEVGEFENPKSGFSARTAFVPLRYKEEGQTKRDKIVVRLESPEPAVYPQQAPGLDVEIALQYRVMECVAHASETVPLAPLIGYEADASLLGAEFFVMGFLEGEVLIENPPYTREGFFMERSPDERRRTFESGLRILADVHRIDYQKAGLEFLVDPAHEPGLARQLDLWARFGTRELGDRELPLFDESVAWLNDNLPIGLENRFSWGDSRPGNIIYKSGNPLCITDFENAAIAPAEFDLGWWLMFDRTMHDAWEIPRLDGEPTREEQRDFYLECAGRDLGSTHYFEVLAAMRYTAIVVRVMNRAVERGLLPEDHVIWKNNPALSALELLLDES